MSFSVTMPALGESVSEGTVTRWLKQEGDHVDVDEPLLEVSTDKVDTEIPSPTAGVLQRIVVSEDETVDVGAELAVIGDSADGEQPAGAQSDDQSGEQAGEQASDAPDAGQQDSGEQDSGQQGGGEQESEQQGGEEQQAPQGAASSGGGGGDDGTPVTMPALGESVTEGTITRWLKQVGDRVEVDEPLLEVSTDKVDTEIPSPVAGVLVSIAVGEDETVEVGGQLAVVGESAQGGQGEQAQQQQPAQEEQPSAPEQAQQGQPAEQQEQPAPQQAAPAAQPQQAAPAAQQEAPQQQASQQQAPQPQQAAPAAQQQDVPAEQQRPASESAEGSAYVTPLVRKLAAEHGVELSNLSGTGVGGRIRKQDVLAAAEQQRAQGEQQATQQATAPPTEQPAERAPKPAEESPLRGTTEKMSRLRKVIAARMVESLQTSAQLTTVVEVDVTKIARLRNRAKGDFETREGVRLSFLPFFAKATVEALKSHPRVNSSVNGEEIVYHGAEHLGVAVDTERGLLVPVIKDAGDLNIAGLARKIADLAERTRSNKITPDELGGGTFTLTNTGSRGALFDTPIINQPQVGILGTGSVVKRAVVVDDEDLGETIAVRSMIYLALSYDHRIVDGADAVRFLATIKARLEEGRFESDLGL